MRARPAVFVDRDGTIIHDRHYLGDPAGVELLPGAGEALRTFRALGYVVVVVTNQSGIGRGYFAEADFHAVHRRMEELLAAEGASVDAVYHCPHAPDVTPGCACRKPATGLFERAIADLALDPSRSFFIGDRGRDVEPARVLGGAGILLDADASCGSGDASAETHTVVPDLLAAARLIASAATPS